jgi:hypothetical protein
MALSPQQVPKRACRPDITPDISDSCAHGTRDCERYTAALPSRLRHVARWCLASYQDIYFVRISHVCKSPDSPQAIVFWRGIRATPRVVSTGAVFQQQLSSELLPQDICDDIVAKLHRTIILWSLVFLIPRGALGASLCRVSGNSIFGRLSDSNSTSSPEHSVKHSFDPLYSDQVT